MRLRSGLNLDGSARGGAGMAEMEEVQARLQAVQNELARVKEELSQVQLAQSQQGSSASSRGRPVVRVPEAVAGVAALAELSDIPHQPSNPVQRSTQAPASIALLDLEGETGYIRANRAGAPVAREYAETVAPVLSYLFDLQHALEQQCSAADIPEVRRKSLAVVMTGLQAVVEFVTERHDLLVAKGEFKHDPCLVQALEQSLAGVEGLPIVSSRVQQLLERQASARVLALTKQSAQRTAGPSRGSNGSNPPAQ